VKKTALLADSWPDGGVARQYGIFRRWSGFGRRAAFIVGADGVVRFRKVCPIRRGPVVEEVIAALKALR